MSPLCWLARPPRSLDSIEDPAVRADPITTGSRWSLNRPVSRLSHRAPQRLNRPQDLLEVRQHICEAVERPFGLGRVASQGLEASKTVPLVGNNLPSPIELIADAQLPLAPQLNRRQASLWRAPTVEHLAKRQFKDDIAVSISDPEIIGYRIAPSANGFAPHLRCRPEGFQEGCIRISEFKRIICLGFVQLIAIEIVEKELGNVSLPTLTYVDPGTTSRR
jgi:hypothetical protein